MHKALDAYDRKILVQLQRDSTLSAAEIGEAIGLSQASCWRRINRLQSENVITKQIALVDPVAVGYGTIMLAHIKLSAHGRQNLESFSAKIEAIPNVLECFLLLGNQDFFIKIAVKDIYEYETLFFREISVLEEIAEVHSAVVLSEIKNSTELAPRDTPGA